MDIETKADTPDSKSSSWIIIGFIIFVVIAVASYTLSEPQEEAQPITQQPTQAIPQVDTADDIEETIEDETVENNVEQETSTSINFDDLQGEANATADTEPEQTAVSDAVKVPALNNSDNWITKQLVSYIPATALHSLVAKTDIARKFVVFTDNFSQGILAYQHSPLVKYQQAFAVQKNKQEIKVMASPQAIDAANTIDTPAKEDTFQALSANSQRFQPYLELFLTLDSDTIVSWYQELSPLFNQAYEELGYEEQSFNDALQLAIGRIITFDMPDQDLTLIQPHVMYQYKNEEIESMPDADKLLIRLGEENLKKLQRKLEEVNKLLN